VNDSIPREFRSFRCAEYFNAYQDGRYDADGQWWFILPANNVTVDTVRQALVVGSPGADGIDFCYRAGLDGIWAYYPIEDRWSLVASTLRELEQGWLDGTISV